MADQKQEGDPMQKFLWSLKNGELEIVKEFVEKKKDLVDTQVEGRYPLHFAADCGHDDVVEYLIQKGASVDKMDKHEITPLLSAIFEGHKSTVELLIKKGAKKDGKFNDALYSTYAETDGIKALLK